MHSALRKQSSFQLVRPVRASMGIRLSVIFAIAILLFSSWGNAQISGTASIQGTIADSTGAVIPDASVTITNEATQVKHSTTSGKNGLYSFPNIDIGTYTLTASAQGF